MDNRWINEAYQEIAKRLIDEAPELEELRGSDVQILCLSSEAEPKSSGRLIFGKCEPVPAKYKWGIPCDFTITIFDRNCSYFTDKQLEILMLHELMHIGVDGDHFYTIPHDVEDFTAIINKYGPNWNSQGWEQLELDV